MDCLSTNRKLALAVLFIASAAGLEAVAFEKLEEGLSTGVTRRGNLNRVEKAYTTDPVYYWIRFPEKEGKKSTSRCLITDPRGVPVEDSTDNFEEEEGDGYLFCGVDGDEQELRAGTYKFEIFYNGEKVGERSIPVDERSFFGQLTARKKYKYAMGVLGLIVLVGGWLAKKHRGGKESKDSAVPVQGVRGVAIGSGIAAAAPGATATMKAATPAAPTLDEQVKNFKAKLAVDPNFKLARAEDVLPIAKAARASGDAKTAIAAVRGFDKTFPGHALIPDVFIFSAKLLAEDFKNVDMARKILEHVVAKYPGHHLAQEARNYLKAMPQTA